MAAEVIGLELVLISKERVTFIAGLLALRETNPTDNQISD